LCPYDPQWPALFAFEAGRIQAALPGDAAIEHIGSTAVPGLLAKPVIDIMIGAEPHHSMESLRTKLVALGYEDMGEAGVPGRIYMRRRTRTHSNVALVRRGGPVWAANLALREYLRANPGAVSEYTAAKRSAVESGARLLLAYSNYKSKVVRESIARAFQSSPGSPAP
jgi:GrpB-like predicted nucleotidyltransferase (UPF0157 family)